MLLLTLVLKFFDKEFLKLVEMLNEEAYTRAFSIPLETKTLSYNIDLISVEQTKNAFVGTKN